MTRIFIERLFEFAEEKDRWLASVTKDPQIGNIKEEVVTAMGGKGETEYFKVTIESFRNMYDTKKIYPDAKYIETKNVEHSSISTKNNKKNKKVREKSIINK